MNLLSSLKPLLLLSKAFMMVQNVNASFPLALTRLPIYTQKALKATAQIPLGYVASYGSIAKAVGGGPRAVGNVMASNPFAPIIPCHRVVKSDFTLGGYGGGLKVKLELLSREKRGFSSSKEIEVNGRQLQVFPVEYSLRNFSLNCSFLLTQIIKACELNLKGEEIPLVNRGLYVGRFQPFHLGHLGAIKAVSKRN